jgi:hypothetical protein
MKKFDNDFQREMENHLIKFKEEEQYLPSASKGKRCFYSELSDNLFPPIRHGFSQYIFEKGMPLHDYVNHVRSSQAYCINLLYPMISQNKSGLLNLLNTKLKEKITEIKGFEFEYSTETNILGEWKSDENRPEEYVTAVDLKLDLVSSLKELISLLLEVKFTESGFTNCGGFNSGGNQGDFRLPCNDSSILLSDFTKCYLNGAKLKRHYFSSTFNPEKSFKKEVFQKDCPFISNHQCLRNHSLAKHLSNHQKTYFGLLYHEENESILKAWKDYKSILNNTDDLFEIKGIEIISASNNANLKKYYQDRYTLTK